jgi:hypothetical protein
MPIIPAMRESEVRESLSKTSHGQKMVEHWGSESKPQYQKVKTKVKSTKPITEGISFVDLPPWKQLTMVVYVMLSVKRLASIPWVALAAESALNSGSPMSFLACPFSLDYTNVECQKILNFQISNNKINSKQLLYHVYFTVLSFPEYSLHCKMCKKILP